MNFLGLHKDYNIVVNIVLVMFLIGNELYYYMRTDNIFLFLENKDPDNIRMEIHFIIMLLFFILNDKYLLLSRKNYRNITLSTTVPSVFFIWGVICSDSIENAITVNSISIFIVALMVGFLALFNFGLKLNVSIKEGENL